MEVGMKMFRRIHVSWLCSAASSLLVLIMLSSTVCASDVRYLWQSRDQFVALEQQDSTATGPAQPNEHPLDLTLDRVTAILESIEMRADDGGKPEALLTRPAVQALAPQLRRALQQASPTEDVTFAIIGLHDALYGLAKSPKVTTGRVFYKAGKLNIIVGLVQQEVRDRDDRRLFPFTPGIRKKPLEGEWTLLPQHGQNGYTQIRKDWVAFSTEWQATVAQPPVAEKIVPSTSARPAPSIKQSNDARNPAERLNTIKELKEKGLISEEEYRSKRMEIFNTL
jgi:hypothetical protein